MEQEQHAVAIGRRNKGRVRDVAWRIRARVLVKEGNQYAERRSRRPGAQSLDRAAGVATPQP